MNNNINYVTPEMYNAVGDGVADDTLAIQNAINSNAPVVLSGTYRIASSLIIDKDNQILTINGKLIVDCDAGIRLTGSWNTIDGGGEVRMISASDNSPRTAIRILVTDGQNRGNVISVRRFYGGSRQNYNIGIEITGNGTSGGCCYDRVTSDIEFFKYGIWCHKSEAQHELSWYTNLYVDSSITGCIQAVVFDETGHFGGSGSFIKGAIQPLYKSELEASESLFDAEEVAVLPLVKVYNNCTIESFVWDLDSAANTYAIEVTGNYNIVNMNLKEKYINIPNEFLEKTYVLREFTKNGCKILAHRDAETNALNAFSNENDILLDCFNREDVVVSHSNNLENYYVVTNPSNWEKILFDGTNLNTSPDITTYGWIFEFAEAKALRGFALWGTRLPDTIQLKVLFTGDSDFTDVAELKAGIDYAEAAYPYQATWAYKNADYSKFSGFNKRNIEKLRVDFVNNATKTMNIARMAAFDVEPVNLKRKANQKYVDEKIQSIEERLTAGGL